MITEIDSKNIFDKNLDEQFLYKKYPQLLNILLIDRTTGNNILWATDNYERYGILHQAQSEITVESITGKYSGIIAPRVYKSRNTQISRTKKKAEVFTPSWICNLQNNLVDEAWFGKRDIFNYENDKTWIATTNKIEFPDKPSKRWSDYIDECRLEITCGEAPYLVSRYDATTAEAIQLNDRIGLLDRKLRVVDENVETEADWLKWSQRAFESIYGFEYQGDSLFLARENLLATYVDYMNYFLSRNPSEQELLRIADIISWNIWQMDGLTGYPPYSDKSESNAQPSLFDLMEDEIDNNHSSKPCIIKDWRENKINVFNDLLSKGNK
ncbi:restriction endonuclease subunit M [Gardnerella vaginalis]|uniref:restriction endonuclease subunit M n=1 Tax=Gardnerella vaginalis TaxID=2702 RepID=UPI0039F07E83